MLGFPILYLKGMRIMASTIHVGSACPKTPTLLQEASGLPSGQAFGREDRIVGRVVITSINEPRGSIYTTIMELVPKRPSPLWFWGPNSIMVVYMDPLGKSKMRSRLYQTLNVRTLQNVETYNCTTWPVDLPEILELKP